VKLAWTFLLGLVAMSGSGCSGDDSSPPSVGASDATAYDVDATTSGLDAPLGAMAERDSSNGAVDSPTGRADGSSDGAACTPARNDLECGAPQACGPIVEPLVVIGAQPLPQGGTIIDGTYELRAIAAFLRPGDSISAMLQVTRTFSKGTMSVTVTSPTGTRETSGSYSTSGTTLTSMTTCPADASGSDSFEYSVTSDTVILYEPVTNGTLALSHVRLP
jgi:hypothetical protein